jgi:hypothetical protein
MPSAACRDLASRRIAHRDLNASRKVLVRHIAMRCETQARRSNPLDYQNHAHHDLWQDRARIALAFCSDTR